MISSSASAGQPSARYGLRYRVAFYRGPSRMVEEHDWFNHRDLPGMLDTADSLAGDDALWSLAVVLADPDGESLVWLVGMNYLQSPTTRVERDRRRDMEERFLLKRSLAGQLPPTLPDGRRVIRMFCDYTALHPLWENHTEHYPALPEDFGLSEELGQALRGWQQRWEQIQESRQGWPGADLERWVLEGDQLADRVEREAGSGFTVRREYRNYRSDS